MKRPQANHQLARWRLVFVVLVLLLLAGLLLAHLARVQVLPGEEKGFEFLQNQGEARTLREERIAAYRGVITDRNGEPLAVSTPVLSLWANPKLVPDQSVDQLAKALAIKPSQLRQRLAANATREFIYLKRHLPPQDANKVLELDIPGVSAEQEYRRYYPAAEVTSHLVGFTNVDERGQEGIELAYDAWLEGHAGSKQVLRDLKGRNIKEVALLKSAESGKDLALSIDLRLQYLAYRELKAAVQAHQAKAGSIVVMDVGTGEVLAMANQPSYNPNDRTNLTPAALRNRAITDQFEPGSTVKPITIMTALEAGTVSPHTTIETSPGYIRVGKKTLLDPVNYGTIDVTKIITKSSQVGLTKVALKLQPEMIRNMYARLGFGQVTDSGFPGESAGQLPNYTRWQPIVQANYAFGYGLTVTALQLAQAYTTIAAGGVKKPVSILRLDALQDGERVVEPRYTGQLVDMLKTVVQPGGTAVRANLETYPVAGKTGTAHKVGPNGYEASRYRSLFAGMAPADDPRLVVVVVIDEPGAGKYFGGDVAAPVFARVADSALRTLQVPPVMTQQVARGGRH
ncbi:peptidoglycan D,D-transpeptidase FtsI family protein [Simiduia agarivorans]|uniref:Peptidoglycan D,D-transpeptidase FtsI n=1 Tax=Simiduia agarivorans (strain DSM 21679 / JCM 13881 / BCRC 17597 / SA1) TaxID=1117647 RepID=H8YHX4_SIMAS|nr:penicillin-binding transpeptidase domain-containing protein [Simiduia agarivorans]AFD30824.1 FtsI [Simiduia agarivorans SA1 = DSM 21679]AFV00685.1 peptidoglycan synthetase FtsI [Simiduia agarivorans SA1 = DSM 21679]